MAQELLSLARLVTESVARIDELCKAKGTSFPSLNQPFSPASEEIRAEPGVKDAIAVLAAAAEQIVATVWQPSGTIIQAALGFHISSAMQLAMKGNVAEFLREAGPKGAHVDEICDGLHVAPQKLARSLRLLATKHIFREVTPDVFCNNILSSMLDTGKSVAQLRADPANKHQGTSGFVALVEHCTDEMFKASAYMTEALMGEATAASEDPDDAAFHLAFPSAKGTTFWGWMDLPENRARLQRFGMGMVAGKITAPPSTIFQALDWAGLPDGATVVDVGGGVGGVSLVLAQEYPKLHLVVQDRAKTIDNESSLFWRNNMPDAITSGRVELEAHDFFEQQPRTGAAVFIMRYILHDWSDAYAAKILQRLRDAAGENTCLIVVDALVPYACRDPSVNLAATQIRVGEPTSAPEPLLSNMGIVNAGGYLLDLEMLVGFNGQERTHIHFERLMHRSGWKIERVHQAPGGAATIIAKPA